MLIGEQACWGAALTARYALTSQVQQLRRLSKEATELAEVVLAATSAADAAAMPGSERAPSPLAREGELPWYESGPTQVLQRATELKARLEDGEMGVKKYEASSLIGEFIVATKILKLKSAGLER